VPIFDGETAASREKGPPPAPADPGAAGGAPPLEPPPVALTAFDADLLDTAVEAYLSGDYGDAQGKLEALLEAEPPAAVLPRLLRYLGFCAIAHDEAGDAEDYFRRWIELEPSARLDRTDTSPKILAVFDKVRDEMSSPAPAP
jgi:hypothetical protein